MIPIIAHGEKNKYFLDVVLNPGHFGFVAIQYEMNTWHSAIQIHICEVAVLNATCVVLYSQ